MSDSRQLRVFLCHASEDQESARKVYKRLKDDGIDAWLDKESILPGQEWQLEIPRMVRNSDVVLVFLSKRAIEKQGYIQKEIKLALDTADQMPEGRIYIVPVRLEEVVPPERLSRWQWVDIFRNGGYEKLKAALKLVEREISGNTVNAANIREFGLTPAISNPENNAPPPIQITNIEKKSPPKRKINLKRTLLVIGMIVFVGLLGWLVYGNLSSPSSVAVTVMYDGKTEKMNAPINSTVSLILQNKGITLGPLDRVEPPPYTSLTGDEIIKVMRVREEITVRQAVIPFEVQEVRNENLSKGEQRVIQSGINGVQEITTRILYENNVQVGTTPLKKVTLQTPVPEIIMFGP